jgi:hypothetical protein
MRLAITVCAYLAGMRQGGFRMQGSRTHWSWPRRALVTLGLAAGGCVAVGLGSGTAQAAEREDPAEPTVSVERVVDEVVGRAVGGGPDRGDSAVPDDRGDDDPRPAEAAEDRSAGQQPDRSTDRGGSAEESRSAERVVGVEQAVEVAGFDEGTEPDAAVIDFVSEVSEPVRQSLPDEVVAPGVERVADEVVAPTVDEVVRPVVVGGVAPVVELVTDVAGPVVVPVVAVPVVAVPVPGVEPVPVVEPVVDAAAPVVDAVTPVVRPAAGARIPAARPVVQSVAPTSPLTAGRSAPPAVPASAPVVSAALPAVSGAQTAAPIAPPGPPPGTPGPSGPSTTGSLPTAPLAILPGLPDLPALVGVLSTSPVETLVDGSVAEPPVPPA